MHATRGDAAIPSLFADDAAPRVPASRPGLLAELEAPLDARRRTPQDLFIRLRSRPWRAATAIVAFVVALSVLMFLAGGGGAYPAQADAQRVAPGAQGVTPAGGAPVRRAVILDDPPPPRVLATEGGLGPALGGEEDPMQLLRGREAPVAAPAPRRRAVAPVDTDVDLLAALMHHTGRVASPGASAAAARGGPVAPGPLDQAADAVAPGNALLAVSLALAACPAANTDAGLACRESACSGRWGEHPSCPRPTAPNAGTGREGSGRTGP